jgi:MinD superfamily P-loop ATPase
VIASVTGNDYAVLVTEPTPSGYADMLRALEIVDHFGIKKGMIINKYDLNEVYTKKIEDFAKRKCINILVKIPFDRAFIKAMIEMIPVIKSAKEYDDIFTQIKNSIVAEIDM